MDSPDAPPPTLGARIPGLPRLPIAEALRRAEAYARVERGAPAAEAQVAALEASLGATLPEDYKTFLVEVGGVKILGDDDAFSFGLLEVFGAEHLEAARDRFRAEMDARSPPGWLEAPVPEGLPAPSFFFFAPEPGYSPPTPEEKRARLREALELRDEHVLPFHDDGYDALRIAYRHLIPAIQASDDPHQGIDCVGPGGRMYYVDVVDRTVDRSSDAFRKRPPSPPDDTFAACLRTQLAGVIVR